MTYLVFLLVFLCIPIGLLHFLPEDISIRENTFSSRYAVALICLLAFSYTTPWDNYLVYRGVWWYGDERVLATIGYVPIEEYLFFLLQPILTGLLYTRLVRYFQRTTASLFGYSFGVIFFLAITAIGFWFLFGTGNDTSLYMGLILAWASPLLLGLWIYGGRMILRLWKGVSLSISLPTLYLWVADRFAIGNGIWDISDTYSFNIDPWGLPIEEATFFLVTNLLVVFGMTLFRHGKEISLDWKA